VVVSPHLDDAVLSCTALLASRPGARVVTAYTAAPSAWRGLTEWDRQCGFRAGDDVMAARKQEDVAALAVLGAEPVWLDLVEEQYESRPGPEEVARRLREAMVALSPPPLEVAVPLGVDHADHLTVSDAMLALRAEGVLPAATWLLYGDLPYAAASPEEAEARRASLADRGIGLERQGAPTGASATVKRAALARYRTQIRPLWDSLPLQPELEELWRLT
jgi:LmbE family N-acetylglucosaminyl deacetylase